MGNSSDCSRGGGGAEPFSSLLTRNGTADGYSVFTLTLHICNASANHTDEYSCVVAADTNRDEAKLTVSLAVG